MDDDYVRVINVRDGNSSPQTTLESPRAWDESEAMSPGIVTTERELVLTRSPHIDRKMTRTDSGADVNFNSHSNETMPMLERLLKAGSNKTTAEDTKESESLTTTTTESIGGLAVLVALGVLFTFAYLRSSPK